MSVDRPCSKGEAHEEGSSLARARGGIFVVTVAAAAFVGAAGPSKAGASSHREAPLIADDAAADNTDVYAFVSPDAPNTVTILANFIPFEDPAALGAARLHGRAASRVAADRAGHVARRWRQRLYSSRATEEP